MVKRSGGERARVAFSLAERETHEISLPVTVPVAPATAPREPNPSPRGLSLVAGSPAAEPTFRPWWKSPGLWLGAAGVAVAATVVTVFVLDKPDPVYSGNVPPGIVSVR